MYTEKIPNILILSGIIAAIIYRVGIVNDNNYLSILLSFFTPVILLFPIFIIRAIGAGDIKLLAVTGLFLGGKRSLLCLCFSIVAGGIIALIKMLVNKNVGSRIAYLSDFIRGILRGGVSSISSINYMGDGENIRGAKIHFSTGILLGVLYVMWRY